MTSKDAMNIFYLKQEVKSMRLSIRFYQESVCSKDATDYLQAIQYDGMPHSPNRSREAPFEKTVIEMVDSQSKSLKRLEKAIKEKLERIDALSEEMEAFLQTIESPKVRSIIRLRCETGYSWEKIGEVLKMDRRTASRKFYAAFGELKEND